MNADRTGLDATEAQDLGPQVSQRRGPHSALRLALLRRLGPEGEAIAREIEAQTSEMVPGAQTTYLCLPWALYQRATALLDRQGNPAIYRELRALGVEEGKLASMLDAVGAQLTEMPIAPDQEGGAGYTAYAHYFATGEGHQLWYLFDSALQSPEQAREAWLGRFFAGDAEAGTFYGQGLQLIRGDYDPGIDPSRLEELGVQRDGTARWWHWESNGD